MPHSTAYFCAEYGLDNSLPLYAGGLGVLAGDTVKQAVDDELDFTAIGLMYRGDDMVQKISPEGWQTEEDFHFDPFASGFEPVYFDEQPLFIKVSLSIKNVWLRCWKKSLSDTVTLYLLDSDTDQNEPADRNLTRQLYFGNDEYQLQQQLLLGIGGVKLLKKLGLHPELYHLNEGRPALLQWQHILELMRTHSLTYNAAHKIAVQNTVYTNHTLVSAGNKQYPFDLMKKYSQYYADAMNISIDELLSPGTTADNMFSVTDYALNSSRKANGVSKLHTELSRQNWPSYNWVSITNGVHMPTWQDTRITSANNDEDLWNTHLQLKKESELYFKQLTGFGYNPEHLIIGWARRLAGYKRLEALFEDVERLKTILKNPDQPVQLLLSGKVHQGNDAGKEMLQQAIQYMQEELSGNVLYIPNYNLEIARYLTRGVDVWLNTPEIGKEACGTSGMKAIANGVLQCSVADGWAAEAPLVDIGWVLDSGNISESVYSTIEKSIAPSFYDSSSPGLPSAEWLLKMRQSISLSSEFSAKRMLDEYVNKLYK